MRQATFILLAALLVLISGYAGYRVLFGADGAPRLVVTEATGDVRRDDGDGMPRSANAGDILEDHDRLKVGVDGHAVLGVGDRTELRLAPGSTVRVLEVNSGGVRVELEEGRVQALVRAGAPLIGVSSRGRAALTSNGEMTVGVESDGTFAVQANDGEVELQGMGVPGRLTPGQRVVAAPGQKPALSQVSESLLLNVAWPDRPQAAGEQRRVTGRTEPYVRVAVTGKEGRVEVRADAEGRFQADLPGATADSALSVEATDPLGRQARSEAPPMTPGSEPVPVSDPTPPRSLPPLSSEVVWGGAP